jgi:carbon-monoxide dehydrogenase medium subunit
MFHQPETLEHALELRGRLRDRAVVVNGGTDVLVAMNHRALHPRGFLDLSRVRELRAIERDGDDLCLGAGTTFSQMGCLDIRCLQEAALSVGGPQIRNAGTIGGNLVTASPAGDGIVALLVLDAQVELASAERGRRWLDLDKDWFLGYRDTALADDELVTRVRVRSDYNTAWYKIGKRGAVNISIICCAAARTSEGQYRLAFGSVHFRPVRAPAAERLLAGPAPTQAAIEQAAQSVMREVSPIDDHRGGADYRRAMCGVLTRRLVRSLAQCEGEIG